MSNNVETPDEIVQLQQLSSRLDTLEKKRADITKDYKSENINRPTVVQQLQACEDEASKIRWGLFKIYFSDDTDAMRPALAKLHIKNLDELHKLCLYIWEEFACLEEKSHRVINHLGKIAVEHGGMTKEELGNFLENSGIGRAGPPGEGSK